MFPTASVWAENKSGNRCRCITGLHARLNRDDYAELWQLLSGLLPICREVGQLCICSVKFIVGFAFSQLKLWKMFDDLRLSARSLHRWFRAHIVLLLLQAMLIQAKTYSLTACLFDEHISYLACHCVMWYVAHPPQPEMASARWRGFLSVNIPQRLAALGPKG